MDFVLALGNITAMRWPELGRAIPHMVIIMRMVFFRVVCMVCMDGWIDREGLYGRVCMTR